MRLRLLLFPCLTFFFCGILVGCDSKSEKGARELTGEMLEGKKLAEKYCSSCHLPVEPELLDKDTWKNQVLPAMAKQLGLEVWQGNKYFQNEKSTISHSDWLKIIAFYDSLAPVSVSQVKPPVAAISDWAGFTLKIPNSDTSKLATTTLVAINKSEHAIYTSSAENPDLIRWDKNLKSSFSTKLSSPAVDISFAENNKVLTLIGEMKAYDSPSGALFQTDSNGGDEIISSGFIRPISTTSTDFNKDGLADYVVCGFGHNKGGLYLVKQLSDKTFEKIPIREVAGATQAITRDFNEDGWPDIMALFAHAGEGIWIFLNDKKGGFSSENILRFPPVYGSSSFQLADINKDGKQDIIYTAGDNSDYSRILKPYHGLYIFLNRGDLKGGKLNFEQAYFYPIHGATKVIAKDFDQDGDIDLATIAFFADFQHNPSGSFLYFEQNNKIKFPNFIPHALPISNSGRWICMDAEDFDGDGDTDIVLGNYSKGFLNQDNFKPNWNLYLPFVLLVKE
ncbi:VCBS repeat-containing protein [Dyadobacter sp. CY345]|uniref:FG-GAP repeat domain-containing protein n=1 Tax=Dyadobacter sp. CY345 TaxID=2909335 RepID=UPI001F2D9BED|nr:VCBS repeat-containing protein [Dyadobacter sp. CY345]MCF2443005.1 VCBS repeat-containing protein [Dyadobacter sp. CY345]